MTYGAERPQTVLTPPGSAVAGRARWDKGRTARSAEYAGVRPTWIHRTITAVVYCIFALGIHSSVQACSCFHAGPEGDYRGLLENTGAVFRGTVLRVQDLTGIPGRDLQRSALRLVVLQVTGVWKGIDQQVAYVFTAQERSACGYPFEEGKEYVVWADRDLGDAPGELVTDTCRSTRELQDASEQLKQLGKPKRVRK